MTFQEFNKSIERIEQTNGYENFIEYYFYDEQNKLLSWIRKECRITRYNKNQQYQAAKGCTYIRCKTLLEAKQKAYELACN